MVKILNQCLRNNEERLRDDSYGEEYLVYDMVTVASGGITTFLFNDILQRTRLITYLPALPPIQPLQEWYAQLRKLRKAIYTCIRPLDIQSQNIAVEIATGFSANFVLPVLVQLLAMRGLNTSSDEMLTATLMSNTGAFKCMTEQYIDFLPAQPLPPFIRFPPAEVPELREEAALLTFMANRFMDQQSVQVIEQQSIQVVKQQSMQIVEQQSVQVVEQQTIQAVEQQGMQSVEQQTIQVVEQQTIQAVEQHIIQVVEQQSPQALETAIVKRGLQGVHTLFGAFATKVQQVARRCTQAMTEAVSGRRGDDVVKRKRSVKNDDEYREHEAPKRHKLTLTEYTARRKAAGM